MNVLFLFLFIGTSTYYATADQPPFYWSKSGLNITALEKAVDKKCTDINNTNHCKAASKNYKECISTLDPLPLEPAEDYQGFCKYLKEKKLAKCVKNIMFDLLPIMDKTEEYLQQLLLNSFNFRLKEFCGVDGFSNTKYFFDKLNRTSSCIVLTGYLLVANGTCTSDLNVLKDLDKGVLNLNKQDVCLDLESLQKCIGKAMERECNEDFSRFFDLIFRPWLEECNTLNKEF